MPMPVMDVWVVWVRVSQFIVAVLMSMRLARRISRGMGVLVMLIVRVQVLVLKRLVAMLVLVVLGEM